MATGPFASAVTAALIFLRSPSSVASVKGFPFFTLYGAPVCQFIERVWFWLTSLHGLGMLKHYPGRPRTAVYHEHDLFPLIGSVAESIQGVNRYLDDRTRLTRLPGRTWGARLLGSSN